MNTIRKFILLPVVLNLFDAVINKTTSATTGNDLSGEMKTFYSDYLIDMAEPLLVHDQFGQKRRHDRLCNTVGHKIAQANIRRKARDDLPIALFIPERVVFVEKIAQYTAEKVV